MAVHQPDLVMCRKQPGIGESKREVEEANEHEHQSHSVDAAALPNRFLSTSTSSPLNTFFFFFYFPALESPIHGPNKQPSAASARNVSSILPPLHLQKEREREREEERKIKKKGGVKLIVALTSSS